MRASQNAVDGRQSAALWETQSVGVECRSSHRGGKIGRGGLNGTHEGLCREEKALAQTRKEFLALCRGGLRS